METSTTPRPGASFGPVKQIEAGVLNTGYVEAGPAGGPAVIVLHGWPYDIHSYADVTPALASAGYRVIVPFARGYASIGEGDRPTSSRRSGRTAARPWSR
jgi:pimeloyl-ACP methyl ester carboxylesterase